MKSEQKMTQNQLIFTSILCRFFWHEWQIGRVLPVFLWQLLEFHGSFVCHWHYKLVHKHLKNLNLKNQNNFLEKSKIYLNRLEQVLWIWKELPIQFCSILLDKSRLSFWKETFDWFSVSGGDQKKDFSNEKWLKFGTNR